MTIGSVVSRVFLSATIALGLTPALSAADFEPVWREVAPPHPFTFVQHPTTYTPSGRAAFWNLADEFTGASNPAGEWTMGYSLNRFGAFTNATTFGSSLQAGVLGWFTPAIGNQPCVVRVDTATVFPALGTGVTLPAGKVGLMPDSLGKFAAVKWTAPQNGQYAIDAQFTGRSTLETGNSDVMVLRNGLQLFFSTLRDPRQIVLFQTVFDLTAGETMEFRVGKSNDSNANDLKQFDLVIQRLPRLCPGNINGDARVDTADLVLLLSQFGQVVVPSEGGDLNGDGVVDTSDMQILLSNVGCEV
ncbi:MAG: hypothetical protein J0L61_06120 [Planctomycetes bacterium]|nr:hypothetical protein [Planctomycetota bacterium]